jgi:hypothetical protein
MQYPTTADLLHMDAWATEQRQFAEQAAASERAYRSNVNRFVEMFLTLGADAVKVAGNNHDQELNEAKGLAAWRWNQQLELEAQIIREEQQLNTRPKTRPAFPGDDVLPDRTLTQRNADWEVETKNRRAGLANLKEQAKRERAELESYTVRRK